MAKIFPILIVFIFLLGCQNIKDGLTLQKKTGADEFLVKKKNPLVLPPEFSELPIPDSDQKKDEKSSSSEIKQLLKDGNNENNTSKATGDTQKIEQNILNKIKNR
tara:strand:+ start:759 stop:1073 length:315 start_codon:yes stop_codon:yes gene_type:complete